MKNNYYFWFSYRREGYLAAIIWVGQARDRQQQRSDSLRIVLQTGSLKATNCVRGYTLLVEFCRTNNVPFELCGKIVVATEPHEVPQLKTLFDRGVQNGLSGMKMLKKEELTEFEPHVTLGVHFTRMAKGAVEAGPNAVLAFSREGYKKSDIRIGELTESLLWPGF